MDSRTVTWHGVMVFEMTWREVENVCDISANALYTSIGALTWRQPNYCSPVIMCRQPMILPLSTQLSLLKTNTRFLLVGLSHKKRAINVSGGELSQLLGPRNALNIAWENFLLGQRSMRLQSQTDTNKMAWKGARGDDSKDFQIRSRQVWRKDSRTYIFTFIQRIS